MKWLILCAVVLVAKAEVSFSDQDDTCDVCTVVAQAIRESLTKHSSKERIEIGMGLDNRKSFEYNKSETRLIETMEKVCEAMDKYRTNYWDPLLPKLVLRGKDEGTKEDADTRQEFIRTENLKGNSAAELLLAFKRQMVDRFSDQADDAAELRRVCGNLMEEFEDELESWYFNKQNEKTPDQVLCIEGLKQRFNFSCCLPDYPDTLDACEDREKRKEEISKKLNEPTVTEPEPEAPLPPGQIRDENGVVWQVNKDDKNPYLDWQPPTLAGNQIMDEQGVIWQVEPDSEAMKDYKIRMSKKKRDMDKKAQEWEKVRRAAEEGVEAEDVVVEDEEPDDSLSENDKLAMKIAREAGARLAAERNAEKIAKREAAAREVLESLEKSEKKTESKDKAAADKSSSDSKSKPNKASTETTKPAKASKEAKEPKEKKAGKKAPPSIDSWLSSIGMGQYTSLFKTAGYDDISVVAEMEKDDFSEIGVELAGHRKKLAVEARKLKDEL